VLLLGRCLEQLPRSEIILSSKMGRYGEAAFDFSAARVVPSLKDSLHRLKTSYLDLVLIHDVEFGDIDQIVNETIPALLEAKAAGLVRYIGVSGLPLNFLRRVVQLAPPNSIDVVLSYCHYCLNDTSLVEIEATTEELDSSHSCNAPGSGVESVLGSGSKSNPHVGLINASPLAMGLLTKKGPPTWHPAPEPLKQAAAAAATCSASSGFDISTLALKFSLKCPSVATTLVGMADVATVEANVTAAMEEMSGEEETCVERLLEIFKPVHNLTWPSGK